MSDAVIVNRENHVLHLQLNRPGKKNALTLAMYDCLSQQLELAESDSGIRVIVLSGSAGNFTAGNDLADFPEPGSDQPNPVFRFIRNIVTTPVPLIAAVEGNVVGIGATMLLYFDAVITARNATFLLPFINLALPPEAGSSLLLPRLMGHAPAADLLMRGKPFDGERARQIGIASTVVEPGASLETALALADEFSSKPPAAMRQTKMLLRGDTREVMERIQLEERELSAALASGESREAMRAFMEKRPPDFSRFS
jgi:enoyl-CoA hydratase/carnithine racemase